MTETKLRCVFVHGWGMNKAIWQPVVDALPEWIDAVCIDLPGHGEAFNSTFDSLQELVSELRQQVSTPAMWVGWSLGGLAVMQLAIQFPHLVKGILLVSSSPSFVVRQDWPCGMAASVFDGFADELEKDYAATIKRFLSLQVKGSDSGRRTLKTLRQKVMQLPPANIDALRSGLTLLKSTDLRAQLSQIDQPVSWVLGGQDGLVKASMASQIEQLLPHAQITVIEKAAHAAFLSHAEEFNQQLMLMAENIV